MYILYPPVYAGTAVHADAMDATVVSAHVDMARPHLATQLPGVYALNIRGAAANPTGGIASIGKGVLVGPLREDGLYAQHPKHMPALRTQVETGSGHAILLVTCEILSSRTIHAVIGL